MLAFVASVCRIRQTHATKDCSHTCVKQANFRLRNQRVRSQNKRLPARMIIIVYFLYILIKRGSVGKYSPKLMPIHWCFFDQRIRLSHRSSASFAPEQKVRWRKGLSQAQRRHVNTCTVNTVSNDATVACVQPHVREPSCMWTRGSELNKSSKSNNKDLHSVICLKKDTWIGKCPYGPDSWNIKKMKFFF